MSRKPKRPYLLRAIYDWIVDSGLTPHVLIDATVAGVQVPSEYVKDGKIVLNVAPHAVRDIAFDETALVCECRFAGRPFPVYLPMPSIDAIYARETGEGMAFEAESFPDPSPEPSGGDGPDQPPAKPPGGGGHLKVVK